MCIRDSHIGDLAVKLAHLIFGLYRDVKLQLTGINLADGGGQTGQLPGDNGDEQGDGENEDHRTYQRDAKDHEMCIRDRDRDRVI